MQLTEVTTLRYKVNLEPSVSRQHHEPISQYLLASQHQYFLIFLYGCEHIKLAK